LGKFHFQQRNLFTFYSDFGYFYPMYPFSRLRRASGKAPHKPILLLAVLEGIESGLIVENRITITPELIAIFQNIWLKLVPHEGWQPRFYLPFFHLTGDKFWHLETVDGAKVALTNLYSPKSVVSLQNSVAFAWLDEPLWKAFADPTQRAEIRAFLLSYYFPGQVYHSNSLKVETEAYMHQLELDFAGKMAAERTAPAYLKTIETEARSAVFQSRVPKIYNYTCAISGLRVTATSGVQMIDACHITPWSSSKNDTIQNGIALTPTLHRAFDRHLIGIDADYRVVVASGFVENHDSPFSLRQFHGKKIFLPEKEDWWPDRGALEGRLINQGRVSAW
jgi:putative restriction endonuclease